MAKKGERGTGTGTLTVEEESTLLGLLLAGLGTVSPGREPWHDLVQSLVEKGESFQMIMKKISERAIELGKPAGKKVAAIPDALRRALEGSAEPGLPARDAELLRRGGLAIDEADLPAVDPVARTAVEFSALLAGSSTPVEVAETLGVDASRIRQRLGDRSLYGVRIGSRWHLPAFQFEGGQQIPGLAEVLPRLDPELSPVAVARWLAAPSPDLYAEEVGRDLSPREWLLTGHPVEPVARLAAGL